jgi:hypothetical protein
MSWCGRCYVPLDSSEFPIAKPRDEDGEEVYDEEDADRYIVGRDGDNLVTPFQCDQCHFRNLMRRDPVEGLPQDVRLLKLIRRANLDALWSREPKTVSSNLAICKQGLQVAGALGFKGQLFRPMGPFPLDDTFGMGAAVVMLQQSLRPGKYDKSVQFGTVRKFRSCFSNVYQASAAGHNAVVMARDTRKLTVTTCPTYGEFFERFVKGLHKRMGEIVKPDRALSLEVLKEIMAKLEEEWKAPGGETLALAMEGAFYLIAYCCALRGEEVSKADLYGILRHWEAGESHPKKHVVVALLGRFKGETGESYHLMCLVAVTSQGLEPRKWIGRLIRILQDQGIRNGPLFRNPVGGKLRATYFEPRFFDRLEQVRLEKPELMPGVDDVVEDYGVSRSFRRGATSEVVNQKVPPEIIDANNRWRRVDQAGASRPAMHMRDHYTDVRQTLDLRLEFSKAL